MFGHYPLSCRMYYNFGQIADRIKEYCGIPGRIQSSPHTFNVGSRAIVGANLVFALPGNAKIRIPVCVVRELKQGGLNRWLKNFIF